MHVFLVTGASKGIGGALLKALLQPGHHVIGISRSLPSFLEGRTDERSGLLEYLEADLSQPEKCLEELKPLLEKAIKASPSSVTVFHNAAQLTPIGPVGKAGETAPLSQHIRLNLLAPLLLDQWLVARIQERDIPKRIIYLSSGAARRPIFGWSPYCSSKAALDMHARVLALEQKEQPYPIQVVSMAPGTVDTQMQSQIRKTPETDFIDKPRFVSLKNTGKLWSPDFVAKQLLAWMHSPDFGSEVLVDLRDWVNAPGK